MKQDVYSHCPLDMFKSGRVWWILALVILGLCYISDCISQQTTTVIYGRLIDLNCGALSGVPYKVVHSQQCIQPSPMDREPPSLAILEDGSGKVIKLRGMVAKTAEKWRLELGRHEVHVTLAGERISRD